MRGRLAPVWAVSFIFWSVYAALTSAGLYAVRGLSQAAPGRANLLIWSFGEAYSWVLVTPIIWSIANRFRFTRQTWRVSLGPHLATAVIVTLVCSGPLLRIDDLMGWAPSDVAFDLRLAAFALVMFPRYFVTLAIILLVTYYANMRARERELAQVEGALTQAQLQALRSQLDPHFLFNTLNSIATLAKKDAAATERMTLQLAALLRVSLESAAPQMISLSKELEFLRNYIAIQEVRFADRLRVHIDVDPNLMEVPVPSLIFQPLVENAIRHGIGKSAFPGRIVISAARYNHQLVLEVVDNGVGIDHTKLQNGNGVGLRNTRNRLQQLYGDGYRFDLTSPKNGGCHVALTIPIQTHTIQADDVHSNTNR